MTARVLDCGCYLPAEGPRVWCPSCLEPARSPARSPAPRPVRPGDWRLTPERFRRLVTFLEELEQNPYVSRALMIAGHYERFSRAVGLLAANAALLELGLAAPDDGERPR